MSHKIISKKLIWGITLFILFIAIEFPHQNVLSEELQSDDKNHVTIISDPMQFNESGGETPKEMSEEEFRKEQEELDKLLGDHVVLYDLADPEGIDPGLLPHDIAALVDSDTKVISYKETVRKETVQNSESFGISNSDNQY